MRTAAIRTLYPLLFLLLFTPPALADDDQGARDYPDPLEIECAACKSAPGKSCVGEDGAPLEEPHGQRVAQSIRDAHQLFFWEVRPTEGSILVIGRTSKLPDGTKLKVAIRVGETPVLWRKAYVIKQSFRVSVPRRQFRPDTLNALVLFEQRGQVGELAPQLRAFPPAYSRRLTFRLGSPVAAAKGSLEEAELLQKSVAALEAHIASGKTLFDQHMKGIKSKQTQAQSCRVAWDQWQAATTTKLRDFATYTQRYEAYYRPGLVTELETLMDRTNRYAKALHRAELKALGVKAVPRGYRDMGMLNTPDAFLHYLEKTIPTLQQALAKAIAESTARVQDAQK